MRIRLVLLPAAAALVAAAGALAAARAPRIAYPWPSSIAAIGDSWTSPLCTDSTCLARPRNSWATGANPAVASHYDRILAHNAAVRGRAWNLAAEDWDPGPTSADLDLQVSLAIPRQPDYVTIFLGGNDVCGALGAGSGTPTAVFRRRFEAGLARLVTALPATRVLLASLDDLSAEWSVLAPVGRSFALPCGLDPRATPARLAEVRARIVSLNAVLADVCARHPQCRFDGGAVFRIHWQASDFSPWDAGHLSLTGERTLAAATWAATYPFGR